MTTEQDIRNEIETVNAIERAYFATADQDERKAIYAKTEEAEISLRRTLSLLGFARTKISLGGGEELEAKRVGRVNIYRKDGFVRAFFTSLANLKETEKRHATNARVRRQMEHSI